MSTKITGSDGEPIDIPYSWEGRDVLEVVSQIERIQGSCILYHSNKTTVILPYENTAGYQVLICVTGSEVRAVAHEALRMMEKATRL